MKYFVIGFNKAATTTMHELFLFNGLRSQHDNKWDLEKYDCFSDNEHISIFSSLYVKYPDAKFILNIRNLRDWITSRVNHCIIYKTIYNSNKADEWIWKWSYPISESKILRDIIYRNNHIKSVLNFFSEMPNNLIIVDVDNRNWVDFLCSQLNMKNKIHMNAHSSNRLLNRIQDSSKEECKKEIEETKSIIDSTFEKICDDPQYKCLIYESNELNNLIQLYANNIQKNLDA